MWRVLDPADLIPAVGGEPSKGYVAVIAKDVAVLYVAPVKDGAEHVRVVSAFDAVVADAGVRIGTNAALVRGRNMAKLEEELAQEFKDEYDRALRALVDEIGGEVTYEMDEDGLYHYLARIGQEKKVMWTPDTDADTYDLEHSILEPWEGWPIGVAHPKASELVAGRALAIAKREANRCKVRKGVLDTGRRGLPK